jgi:hypothetical protein
VGQVREKFTSDVAGLTEWLFRKVRNHDPLSNRDTQVDGVARKAEHNTRGLPTQHRTRQRVVYANGEIWGEESETVQHVIYNLGNGKRFLFTVQEVGEDYELPKQKAVA